MLRPGDRHLTEEEVERLSRIQGTIVLGDQSNPEDASGKHVSECPDCRSRLEQAIVVNSKLASLRFSVSRSPGEFCPSNDEWRNLASGLGTERRSRDMIEHAANCDHCGPLLNEAMAIFSDESSFEEQDLLGRLESTKLDWHAALARRLAHRSDSLTQPQIAGQQETRLASRYSWRTPWKAPRLAWVGALLVVLGLVTWYVSRSFVGPNVNQLLANAYSEKRVMELRIPGANYAPMHSERRTPGSVLDAPQALLDADALISRKLRAAPDDPSWLDAKGRAELLGGDYSEAIKTLQKAQDVKPGSPEILADLAAAYFQRAEAEDHPIDYGLAMDLLSKALTKTPNDTTLLFNRAIVAERAFLFVQASEDWEHYLRVEPDGAWASEARKRLKALQQRLQSYQRNSVRPLLDFSQMAGVNPSQSAVQSELDSRTEDYLHLATVDWLTDVFATPTDFGRPESRDSEKEALNKLAAVAYEKHGDGWLKDLLSSVSSPRFPAALTALQSSVVAADHGDFRSATDQSIKAADLFRRSGNRPGELRARFQKVYSLQLSNKSQECLTEVTSLVADLESTEYSWLRTQAVTERAICLNMAGDIALARLLAKQGIALAEKANYKSLELRATSMSSAFEADMGNRSEAWHVAHLGLARFWSDPSPAMPGYNLYVDLDEIADTIQAHDLRLAIWKEATGLIATNPDTLLRAMAQLRLADAAFEAHVPLLAQAAFAEGNRLLKSMPQDETIQNSEIEASIWFARFEMSNGKGDEALRRLTEALPVVQKVSTRYVTIDFYRTFGELQMRRGDLEGAQRSLNLAIDSAESGLHSLNSKDDRQRWSRETSDAYRATTAMLLKKGETSRALEFWEWYKGAVVRSRIGGNDRTEASKSRSAIVDSPATEVSRRQRELVNESVISYALLSDGLEIWVFDNRGIHSKWVPLDRRDLDLMARRFVRLCSDPNSDLSTVQFYGKKLYQTLLGPISDRLTPTRGVIVEADIPISQIPIQALVDESGHYFGENHAVTWSEGVYFTESLRLPTKLTTASRILVVAAPAASTQATALSPLTSALKEGQLVSGLFQNSDLLTGQQANWPNIAKQLPGSLVFHFAGHALANETQTGLLLAQDSQQSNSPSLLTHQTLPSAWLQETQLAVLAACLTEKGTDDSAFDPDGLAMVFMDAGVPHVIASRWNVDSDTTAFLMDSFYRKLLDGNTVSDSLRLSAEEVRTHRETNHPYYWAAFNSFGRS